MIKTLRTLAFVSVTALSFASFADLGSNLVSCRPTISQAGNVDLVSVSRSKVASVRAGNIRNGEAVRSQNYGVEVKSILSGQELMVFGSGILLKIDLTKVKAIGAGGEKIFGGSLKSQLAGQNFELNNLSCSVTQ